MKYLDFTTIYKTVLVVCLGVFLTNCEGEDGLAGIDGVDGIDGADGIDGVGFDELRQFGGVTITLDGTRIDNASPFTDTTIFEFSAIDSQALENGNSVVVDTDASSISFNVLRFINIPDDRHQESTVEINLTVINPGTENETFDFNMEFVEHNIIFEDLGVLQLDENFSNDDVEVLNFDITDFNFNSDTNTLRFSFSFEVEGINNDSQNDLSVSGEVDVIVLENIGIDN
ncbi:hypothetical protein [uncultured Aquimarina sp.]|uniref:hypothetical protein n=1 Tax=uncultured Aquimarina sp. TaxID=575652 RepID=UPI002620ABD2|nr:hypothetical protein [uncultured Aquimarina sp.]